VNQLAPLLILGSGGMLGRAFGALLEREGLPFRGLDVPDFDLADPETVARAIAPDVRTVINCAAFTDVDGAEAREPEANALNGAGVGELARRCEQVGATLVHYSTDYVFDGAATRPYRVDHPRSPMNAYGRSKAMGEVLLEESNARYLLIRTSWLYAPWGKNFVLTMRHLTRSQPTLKVVHDQVGRPTSAEYLAERSLRLLQKGETGTFHVTDGGQCSWFEFADRVRELCGAECRIKPATTAEYTAEFPRPARRPSYSVLDLSRTDAAIGPSRPWQENLAAVIAQLPR
jgi:dTDP-4-dehydrorhamnose reductase